MVNINDLEKKWLRYKIKSYMPHAILFVIAITTVLVIANTWMKKPLKEQTAADVLTAKIEAPVIKEEIEIVSQPITNRNQNEKIQQTSSTIVEKKSTVAKITLFPSLNFISEINSSEPAQEHAIISDSIEEIEIVKELDPSVQEKLETNNDVKGTVNIKRKNDTQSDIQHVITRFKKSNSPALSLFIAKSYYELGDYNQAYNYALITNEIDNNIEASWIVFAKSLVKMGQKDKAISTLREYVKHSKSSNAKTLLDEIVLGKMK